MWFLHIFQFQENKHLTLADLKYIFFSLLIFLSFLEMKLLILRLFNLFNIIFFCMCAEVSLAIRVEFNQTRRQHRRS